MRRKAVGPSVVRIGGSTYSKRPFEPQARELKEAGFDYCELDLAWIEPTPQLEREAIALSEILPIETAHLPPSRFTREDQARFQRFLDCAAPAGPRIFNVHLLPAKAAPGVALDARTAWLSELVDAAHSRGLTVTLENVEEPLSILADVFTRIPRMQACLDVGHASLDGDNERPSQLLSLIRDRLALVHAHDNRQGHGEAGDLHLPFGRGTIRLEAILRVIRAGGFDGHATLELFTGTKEERAGSASQARAWLTGQFRPPLPDMALS